MCLAGQEGGSQVIHRANINTEGKSEAMTLLLHLKKAGLFSANLFLTHPFYRFS